MNPFPIRLDSKSEFPRTEKHGTLFVNLVEAAAPPFLAAGTVREASSGGNSLKLKAAPSDTSAN